MMLGFGTMNSNPSSLPVNVGPLQSEVFGRTSHSTETAQCKNQAPLGIRAVFQHLAGLFKSHKVKTACIGLNRGLKLGKRVFGDQAETNSGIKKLLGYSAAATDGVVS